MITIKKQPITELLETIGETIAKENHPGYFTYSVSETWDNISERLLSVSLYIVPKSLQRVDMLIEIQPSEYGSTFDIYSYSLGGIVTKQSDLELKKLILVIDKIRYSDQFKDSLDFLYNQMKENEEEN